MTAVTEHEVSLTPAHDLSPRTFAFVADAFPVPTGAEENWRFTPLARLRGLQDGSAQFNGEAHYTLTPAPGAVLESVVKTTEGRVGFTDRVAAGTFGEVQKVNRLTVSADESRTEAIQLTVSPNGATVADQLDIVVDRFAQATVIVNFEGTGTYSGNVDVHVADGASLVLVTMQEWDKDALHVGHHRISLGRDASVKHVSVTLGGDVVRIMPTVEYTAPGGSAELIGLYFAAPGQHVEHQLMVDHSVPHCRSNVVYKGALHGKDAHTVWIGDVLIRAAAVGTDTYEINRNLVLSEGGRADSVPNLEIETGEIVGAGHASTTGRFDDEQLFYLMARGIDEAEARRLVLKGFFEELLGQINVAEINDRVRAGVERHLEESAS